jgi:hypothetical protein
MDHYSKKSKRKCVKDYKCIKIIKREERGLQCQADAVKSVFYGRSLFAVKAKRIHGEGHRLAAEGRAFSKISSFSARSFEDDDEEDMYRYNYLNCQAYFCNITFILCSEERLVGVPCKGTPLSFRDLKKRIRGGRGFKSVLDSRGPVRLFTLTDQAVCYLNVVLCFYCPPHPPTRSSSVTER